MSSDSSARPALSAPELLDDDAFVRALVKSSRQRTIHLRWTDRDGTARLTALTSTEATRVNALARARGLSAEAFLRDAAHQPLAPKPPAGETRPTA